MIETSAVLTSFEGYLDAALCVFNLTQHQFCNSTWQKASKQPAMCYKLA